MTSACAVPWNYCAALHNAPVSQLQGEGDNCLLPHPSGELHPRHSRSKRLFPIQFVAGDLGFWGPGGRLHLLGRLKDMVKSGGENVYASEVESALASHPAVRAAVIVGLPDSRLGECVAAVVILQPGWKWRGATLGAEATGSAPAVSGASSEGVSAQASNSSGSGGGGGGGTADGSSAGASSVLDVSRGSDRVLDLPMLKKHCAAAGLSGYKVPRVAAAAAELPTTSSGKVMKPAVKAMLLQRFGNGPASYGETVVSKL